jgi:hypothetical protein
MYPCFEGMQDKDAIAIESYGISKWYNVDILQACRNKVYKYVCQYK